ncbi:ABC transporter ATP-binding protein [Prescottella agglutinans]|uniref:ABC-2 type transport system ATP-binding protein n=1 Tax=Prescottella agglutinans TaxID=1644129 RepID=A0ABT6MHM3_9NOCA|nr:ABC transporter ATP-binding protein [Prescottella agglutinans]MDH6283735.1 ABC-2 type transport system ATP-binding protein [Prescottella agglutinans]
MSEAGSALTVRDVHKKFRRTEALRGCSFDVERGSITALVGANGAGKSTLMSIAVGLLEPDAGEVTVLGRRPGRNGIVPGLAYVAQHKPLYRGFTVADTLMFGEKSNTQWDNDYATSLVTEAGIPLSARVKTLSPGHRTRVALALALGRRPDVLLLDEPLAELDPLARRSVVRTLMEDAAERGTTIVLSSHVLSEVAEIADRLVILGSGQARLTGALDDLLDGHYLLTGTSDPGDVIGMGAIVESTGRTHLVRGPRPTVRDGWRVEPANLDDVVLAYLTTINEEAA